MEQLTPSCKLESLCRFCLSQNTLTLFAQVKDRRYYRCSHCNITLLDNSQFVSQEEEKKRYDEHINRPEDMGYRNFLRRLTDPLTSRLIELEKSRTRATVAGRARGVSRFAIKSSGTLLPTLRRWLSLASCRAIVSSC